MYRPVALALLAVLPGACFSRSDEGQNPRRGRSRLGASGDVGSSCGAVTFEGCCKGSVLYYCESGVVEAFDCAQNPSCGWDGSKGFYNCGTAGTPDPGGKHPMTCGAVPDAGPAAMPDFLVGVGPCGNTPQAGCCHGQKLFLCQSGKLLQLDCGLLGGLCGWQFRHGFYYCGGGADDDPSGAYPRDCPFDAAVPVPDLGPPPDAQLPCGPVPYEGCCEGQTLKFCGPGGLYVFGPCSPGCGWDHGFKYYNCGTLPYADPTGKLPLKCSDLKDGGIPVPDGGLPCGNVTWQGCCHEEKAYRCVANTLEIEDCRRSPSCGWGGVFPYYTCGRDGSPHPYGYFPKACDFGDAGPPTFKSSCGGLSWQGCCDGQGVRYCVANQPRYEDCNKQPSCGWKTVDAGADAAYSFYACGTGGSADPTAALPRACADAGAEDAGAGCGPVSPEGCCAGERLFFCAAGTLGTIDCAKSPSCGWNAAAGYYDCNTDGGPEPSKKHPEACGFDGGLPILDAGPRDASLDRSIHDAAPAPGPNESGCGCRAGAPPRSPGATPLLALLLLLLVIRGGH